MLTTERMRSYFLENLPNMKSDLQRLCAVPSVQGEATEDAPFGKEAKEALLLALAICEEKGLVTDLVANAVGEASLPMDKETTLGILAHMDVVPAGPGWSVPPFDLTERDGMWVGRGVIDDKGPFIAALYALLYLRDAGATFNSNVRFILGSDEECGSGDLRLYEKERTYPPYVFTPDAEFPLIHIEKGRAVPKLHYAFANNQESGIVSMRGGEIVNAVPGLAYATLKGMDENTVRQTAEKIFGGCSMTIESENDLIFVTAHGKNAHASLPEQGINALKGLWEFLLTLPLPAEQADILRLLVSLFPAFDDGGKAAGYAAADEESGELTSVFSVIDWNEGGFDAKIDIRFPICSSLAGLAEAFEKAFAGSGVSVSVSGADPHSVPADSPFVQKLLAAFEEETGEKNSKPLAIGGGTYVHEIEGGVAFGPEFLGENNNMHGADECVKVENIIKTACIYARAIAKICCED